MKLIIKEYLSSLKERKELDVLLPDLLTMMGLTVFSKPSIGTRQYGVDVAAFGCINNEPKKVYLFSIKAGDLGRNDWDGNSQQNLRSSLNEIKDVYIKNHIPSKYKDKPVEICICFGGNLKEEVRQNITAYEKKNTTHDLTFSEWGGDELTNYINQYFLDENLLPKGFQSMLRKSLALLDEPSISYKHFSQLIHALTSVNTPKDKIKSLRQLRISLGILIAWCKEANNLEAAYLSAELSVLHAWELAKLFLGKNTKNAISIAEAMSSIILAYLSLSNDFVNKISPHINKKYAVSNAVGATNKVDVNLKLFDLLGRVAMNGVWSYQQLSITPKNDIELIKEFKSDIHKQQEYIIQLINNNPILYTPYKDEQIIDVTIAVYFLMLGGDRHTENIYLFLERMNDDIAFNFYRGNYPSNLDLYHELIEHPIKTTKEYKEGITKASILYPYLAIFSALFGFDDIYKNIQDFIKNNMQHCNMQLWYPNESSEGSFYTNANRHGATLIDVFIDKDQKEFLEQIFTECEELPCLKNMSAVKFGFYPIIFLGCRHYRLPIPIHFFRQETKVTN